MRARRLLTYAHSHLAFIDVLDDDLIEKITIQVEESAVQSPSLHLATDSPRSSPRPVKNPDSTHFISNSYQ